MSTNSSLHLDLAHPHLSLNPHQPHKSSPLRPSRLDDLARPRIRRPQHRPARPVRLDERHLHLRAQDGIRRLFRVDRAEQLVGVPKALVVGRGQVEVDGGWRGEDDGRLCLVDFLEEEGGVDGRRGLVEVVSNPSASITLLS